MSATIESATSKFAVVTESRVVIPVNVVASGSSDPDQPYRLQVPVNMLYLEIPWNQQTQIEWRIGTIPEGVQSAMFDAPAVTMPGRPDVMPLTETPQSVTMSWSNDDRALSAKPMGRSFCYRLHVVVSKGEVKIPVSHDPTVHNQPPIP